MCLYITLTIMFFELVCAVTQTSTFSLPLSLFVYWDSFDSILSAELINTGLKGEREAAGPKDPLSPGSFSPYSGSAWPSLAVPSKDVGTQSLGLSSSCNLGSDIKSTVTSFVWVVENPQVCSATPLFFSSQPWPWKNKSEEALGPKWSAACSHVISSHQHRLMTPKVVLPVYASCGGTQQGHYMTNRPIRKGAWALLCKNFFFFFLFFIEKYSWFTILF